LLEFCEFWGNNTINGIDLLIICIMSPDFPIPRFRFIHEPLTGYAGQGNDSTPEVFEFFPRAGCGLGYSVEAIGGG